MNIIDYSAPFKERPLMAIAIGALLQEIPSLQRLDYEVLLAYVIGVSRSYLHAHPEYSLSEKELQLLNSLLEKYRLGVPIAYLVGHKEFWSLNLTVTENTLVPRPETELLVESVLALSLPAKATIADLGTGTGAIALALAHERPDWTIYATDISAAALTVAKKNAQRHNIHSLHFCEGHWLQALPALLFDVIVSNPPYIAKNDPFLERHVLMHEPPQAFISEDNGLKDLSHIIQYSYHYLKPGGHLVVEHGFQQGEAIRCFFFNRGYSDIITMLDFAQHERATKACRPIESSSCLF